MHSRIWANGSLRPARHVRGEFLCTEGSHNGREPHATSRMTFRRETRHHSYPQTAWNSLLYNRYHAPNWKSRPLYILAAWVSVFRGKGPLFFKTLPPDFPFSPERG